MAEVLILFATVSWLLVSVVVWQDATDNSSKSGFLWGLAVFVGGFLGLILYFLLGRDTVGTNGQDYTTEHAEDLTECPNCHSLEERHRDLCRFCDQPLENS